MRNQISPYLEQTIASASPLELIRLYYQTAIQAVRDARAFLAQKKAIRGDQDGDQRQAGDQPQRQMRPGNWLPISPACMPT